MKKLFVFFLFVIILISFVSSAEKDFIEKWIDKTQEGETYKKITDFLKGPLGFEKFKFFDGVEGDFIPHLMVGIFAGFIIYLLRLAFYFFYWSKKMIGVGIPDNPYEEGTIYHWTGIVAGNIFKPIILGVLYAVLLAVPILNRIIQIITLDFLLNNFLAKVSVLAFVVGLLPALLGMLYKARFKFGLNQKVYAKRKEIEYTKAQMKAAEEK